MQFYISSAKLTGNPDASGWTQVHDFTPDKEKLETRGRLFTVISALEQDKDPPADGLRSIAAGREILTKIHEEYFGETKTSAFNALKRALEKVLDEFSSWGRVEIASAAVVDNIVYSAIGGGGEVAVFRNGALATILESKKGEVISASGYPREGDMFLLATERFFKEIGRGVIKEALAVKKPSEAVESIAPVLRDKKDPGSLGVVILKFEKLATLAKITRKLSPETDRQKIVEDSPGKTSSFGISLTSRFSELVKKIPPKKIRVRKGEVDVETLRNKKLAVSTGILLLALLVVSIGFGVYQKGVKDSRSRYEESLNQAQYELDEAKVLFSLNPERARELFASSRSIANALIEEGIEDPELDELRVKITESQQVILGEYEVSPQAFLDLSILTSGFTAEEMAASKERLFILDKKGRRIVRVEVGTKKTEVIVGPGLLERPEKIASYENRAFILEKGSIFEVGDTKIESIEEDWQGDILVSVYAGNLYILEKDVSKIWRYAGSGTDFGSQNSWLAPGISPEFSGVISWAIDGSIWILTASGRLEKYTLGSPQSLSNLAVFPPWKNPSIVYTNEELAHLYVLDAASARVIVFDKNGGYVAQYKSELLSGANGLAVSGENGVILFLVDDKLYSIEMKHL